MKTEYITFLLESENESLSLGETLLYKKAKDYYLKDIEVVTISPVDLMGILKELNSLRTKVKDNNG